MLPVISQVKDMTSSLALVAGNSNPSYSGGRDQEDPGPSLANSS
jgi:hypothetical protein